MEKEREVCKVENKLKCPEYHTPSVLWWENTIIFFGGGGESFQKSLHIYEHFNFYPPYTQMFSATHNCSANPSWICFCICKYRSTSSIDSFLVIRG